MVKVFLLSEREMNSSLSFRCKIIYIVWTNSSLKLVCTYSENSNQSAHL